jgi:hypothetical protein
MLAALISLPSSLHAQGDPIEKIRSEIRLKVRELITATNYDPMGSMALYSQSPELTSVNDISFVRGWDALESQTKVLVPA